MFRRKLKWPVLVALALMAMSYNAIAGTAANNSSSSAFPLTVTAVGPTKVIIGKNADYDVTLRNISNRVVTAAQLHWPMIPGVQVVDIPKGLVQDPHVPGVMTWQLHGLKPNQTLKFHMTLQILDPGPPPPGLPPSAKPQNCLTIIAAIGESLAGNVSQSCAAWLKK